ncbi:MAG: argininosuccinate synthase [Candidatus Hadarchaeum sp.]|uniref:argininosuccinate synthase n=1 Tax=Candidatus Hadarchaeum sp. TaxID=2883567 RepID=UPI003D0DF251
MAEKVVLAFSGGLDTSFCTVYLREEKNFDVITATIDTGGMSNEELEYIENRSKELGAIKHYFVDARKEIFDEIISYIIKANALYQGVYPLMCSDRYIIGKHIVEIAKKENAKAVAHGCTGAGNDQVRIDVTVNSLAPELQILAPTRELGMRREQEIEYLEKRGFKVKSETKKYTINENIFGRTISGSEIDENQAPSEEAWVLTKVTKTEPESVRISFEKGVPTAVNGKRMYGVDLLHRLNQIAGAHGYGRGLYIEDETFGIKGYQAFEAPGLLLLIEAHRALENLVLTHQQLNLKNQVGNIYAELSFRGLFYEPVMRDIEKFLDSTQEVVTGEVTMRLQGMSAMQESVTSPFSLINERIARYAQAAGWKGSDAESFIKIYGLQQRIAWSRKKPEG